MIKDDVSVGGNKSRLDKALVSRRMVVSRSQAESAIKLGAVKVNGEVCRKTGLPVRASDKITLLMPEQYVSRAGLKLASVAQVLDISFDKKIVLDVGSSTGGFTDYALQHGAALVIAVDVGTDQLHPSLRGDKRIELHEQTDIRQFTKPAHAIDIVLIDVSFISLRDVLPAIMHLSDMKTQIVAMVKPQFESRTAQKHKGVIKNDAVRREVLKDFEQWAQQYFLIQRKADSLVAGAHGNRERFYVLKNLGKK